MQLSAALRTKAFLEPPLLPLPPLPLLLLVLLLPYALLVLRTACPALYHGLYGRRWPPSPW
jgi:hypothetical protein